MLLAILVAAGAVALDQISKLLVLRYLAPVGSYPLWRGVLHFTYVENRGAAFGTRRRRSSPSASICSARARRACLSACLSP